LSSHGFLLDRDVSKVSSFFPKKRTNTLADVGLSENARDSEIVRKAWERRLTIVTGNGDDFVREINAFQKSPEIASVLGSSVQPFDYKPEDSN
jgi:hypothetical protein